MKPIRVRLIVGIAVALAVGGIIAFDESPSATSATERPLAPSIEFETFEGETVQLSDFRGTPVVLNFWASWCPACVAEMPDFESVHQSLGDQVTFIGVDMQEISRDAALDLVAQTGISYLLVDDPTGAIYAQFGGLAMPTTVFIDADGRIADTHAGALFADDLADQIDRLLLSS